MVQKYQSTCANFYFVICQIKFEKYLNTLFFYDFQPSWRHLPNSSNFSMIAYRGSDLKMEKDLG
jgi:hypothetical protein